MLLVKSMNKNSILTAIFPALGVYPDPGPLFKVQLLRQGRLKADCKERLRASEGRILRNAKKNLVFVFTFRVRQ